jgi:hypothetical protein
MVNEIENRGGGDKAESLDLDRLGEDSIPMRPINSDIINLDEINNLENLN